MLSKCSMNISNGIPLLFSQSCGISAVPSEEQPPQIGHLSAYQRKQFRVSVSESSKALPDGKNLDIKSVYGIPFNP